MSGTNRLINNENAKNNESEAELTKELMNANEEAAKDEAGEYEKEKSK